jgi:signal-transduction protein with cAMP-binding, CBS, and nucleotidyltransferase domain
MNVTGNDTPSATRSWYRRATSGFGKPRVDLMPDEHPPLVSHTSQSVAALLGTIPSLRFVTPAGLHALADTTHRESVHDGEIIRQGERSDDVFFILDGRFEVLISHFGEVPDFIRTLHAGDSFGELGVLYDVPRTATVRCANAGEVLRIPGDAFLEALETWR